MKQLYFLLILVATFFIHSIEVKGQGSFDIVDPGPQIINIQFTLSIENAKDDQGQNLGGLYWVLIQSLNIFNQYLFDDGKVSIPLTINEKGIKDHIVSIWGISNRNITIGVFNRLWLGEDNSWHNTSNWNPANLPGENDLIGIPATLSNPEISNNYVTVDKVFIYTNAKITVSNSRQLSVKAGGELIINEGSEVIIDDSAELLNNGSIRIEDNGKLTIGPTGSWTANGAVTNSAGIEGIIVESMTNNNTGSIIINNGQNINATVQRYMGGQEWHVISSPVTGQGLLNFLTGNDIPYNTEKHFYAMAPYLENRSVESGGWGPYYTNSATGSIERARGYLAGIRNNGSLEFKGTLTHEQQDRAVTRATNGWNAIGNPFPSAIGVTSNASSSENFIQENLVALDPAFAALYIYDPGSGNYIILNNTEPDIDQDYIQPGQGFLVKAAIGGGGVKFTPEMRVHENTSTFFKKSAKTPWPTIRLKVSGNVKEAATVITFHGNMTRDLDPTYDAGHFGGDPDFRLFTRLVEGDSEIDFAIQALPDFGFEDMVIPVGFDFSGSEEIIFSAEILTLPDGAYAILEDRALGKFTNLETDNYVVKLNEDIHGPGRFYLHTDMQVTSTENILPKPEPDLRFYSFGKEIFINGHIDGIVHASLYDLMGRRIKTVRLQSADRNSFSVEDLKTGIYLLRIVGEDLKVAGRIFIE